MTTLLLVSGSQRRESFNSRLLWDLSLRLKGRCAIDILQANQVSLPLFNQDLETDTALLAQVAALHTRFHNCHGIVVASPEYNGQLTPFLKNLIDWVSRLPHISSDFCNPFGDRPVLLCSASTGGSGGSIGIPSARALFSYVGCTVLGESICIPFAHHAWMDDFYLFDPSVDVQIDSVLDQVLHQATEFARSSTRSDQHETA